MEFDRKGPEGGLEIYTAIDNGKAHLEFKVYLRKAVAEELMEEAEGESLVQIREGYLDIRIWDREDNLVFCCCHPLYQEELAKGMILHPHLWQGVEDPYLYRVRVSLMEKKDFAVDVIETALALRSFQEISRKGWFLNGSPFQIRPVAYVIPTAIFMACMMDENTRRMRIRQELELIRRMGANTVSHIGGALDREFCQICDEMGLLLWWRDKGAGIPRLHGTEDSLLSLHGRVPTDRYYYYRARWSKEPFVYISMDSLALQPDGNARVMVYSNQKKVALYVEGTLFEFQMEGPDFLFEEIPVKRLPLLLTAEASGCSMSVTAYSFTEFSQNNHFSMIFNAYNDLSEHEQV